ncbi:MAG: hypothetical protein HYT10_01570 [Candidatus Levybacteria bacterium]|nr:hypothetical protein [Candidatus Levybacteria bacterium]
MVEVAAELEQLYQPPAGTRRRGTSRAPASVGENPIPPSGGPAGDTPPVIHLREIAPVPRKVLSLLAKGSTPPATLDEAILAAYPEGLSTPEKLLKGGLSGAITGLIRLRNNPSEVESAPTRLRQLYNELGLPGRWEEVETALRQWGVLKDSAA